MSPKFIFFPSQASSGYLLDSYPGAAFAWSKFKLKSGATNATKSSNVALTEADIALDAIEWIAADIETNAAGALATSPLLYDQTGNGFDIPQTNKTYQPNLTDASGTALDYLEIQTQGKGYWLPAGTKIPPSTSGDYIITLVARNFTGGNNQRNVFFVKTSSTDLFAWNIKINGSQYLIDYLKDVESASTPTGGCTYIPTNSMEWTLFTWSVIGGVVRLYINGVEKTLGAGNYAPDSRGTNGLAIALRPVSFGVSSTHDFKTLIMHTGPDLSSFNLSGFNADLIASQNITTQYPLDAYSNLVMAYSSLPLVSGVTDVYKIRRDDLLEQWFTSDDIINGAASAWAGTNGYVAEAVNQAGGALPNPVQTVAAEQSPIIQGAVINVNGIPALRMGNDLGLAHKLTDDAKITIVQVFQVVNDTGFMLHYTNTGGNYYTAFVQNATSTTKKAGTWRINNTDASAFTDAEMLAALNTNYVILAFVIDNARTGINADWYFDGKNWNVAFANDANLLATMAFAGDMSADIDQLVADVNLTFKTF